MGVLLVYLGIGVVALGVYWAIREDFQPYVPTVATLVFLAYQDIFSLGVLLLSSISTYYLLQLAHRWSFYVGVTIILLAFTFIFFKLEATMDMGAFEAALPLGMSFYLFRLLHYAIEVYKGNLKNINFGTLMSFMFYLPVIIIGPIIRLSDWSKEMNRRRWNPEYFSNGLERIIFGLVKITFLGNYLVNMKLSLYITSFDNESSWIVNYLECFQYTANSYLQFAGYSDIAVGFSMLFGIKITENFHFPFLATDISDFWKRWHISLSQWCRDYIFMPIASFTRLPWVAVISSMLVLGLWHELSTRYILWAFFHGLGIVLWNFQDKHFGSKLSPKALSVYSIVGRIITIHFVIFSFAFVKEESIMDSLVVLKILFGFRVMTLYQFLTKYFNKKVANFLAAIIYIFLLLLVFYFLGVDEGDFRYLNY